MIIGIGTDLVECERIARIYQRFGHRFVQKLLGAEELSDFSCCSSEVGFLAKRFAAKEAAAKALGVGIGGRAGLREIVVSKNSQGAPRLLFSGSAAKTAESLGVTAAHVSLSDERQYALAFVVLS